MGIRRILVHVALLISLCRSRRHPAAPPPSRLKCTLQRKRGRYFRFRSSEKLSHRTTFPAISTEETEKRVCCLTQTCRADASVHHTCRKHRSLDMRGVGKTENSVCRAHTFSFSFASYSTLIRRNNYFPSSNSSLASSEVGRRRRRRRRRGRRRPLPLCLLLLLFSEGCSCLHSPPPLFPCTVVAHKGPRIAFITKKISYLLEHFTLYVFPEVYPICHLFSPKVCQFPPYTYALRTMSNLFPPLFLFAPAAAKA